MTQSQLRSPRDTLGGYVILPRLIDKVRLSAQGQLAMEYHENLLKLGRTLDGRFLAFTGLKADDLRTAILKSQTDQEVLAWVHVHARPASDMEKAQWADSIDRYRPDELGADYRRQVYPELAARLDVSQVSVFDLIDWDEGRLAVPHT